MNILLRAALNFFVPAVLLTVLVVALLNSEPDRMGWRQSLDLVQNTISVALGVSGFVLLLGSALGGAGSSYRVILSIVCFLSTGAVLGSTWGQIGLAVLGGVLLVGLFWKGKDALEKQGS